LYESETCYTISKTFETANTTIKRLSRRRARVLKAARKTGKWDKYNNLKRLLQQECRHAHDHWLNNMIQDEGINDYGHT